MQDDSLPVPLDYDAISTSRFRKGHRSFLITISLVSVILPLLQLPWLWLSGVVAWGFLWGDHEWPKVGVYLLEIPPSLLAITLAVIVIRSAIAALEWKIVAGIGCLAGAGWLTYLLVHIIRFP